MRFLLHGKTLSPAVAEALKRHEHHPTTLAESGQPEDAAPAQVLETARVKQLEVLTTDDAVVQHIYDADLWFNRVVVYLQLSGQDVEQDDAIDRLFTRYKRLTPGRLYTVTETRVKVRQLPTKGVKRAGGGEPLFRDADESE
jgi:hypothetical protein